MSLNNLIEKEVDQNVKNNSQSFEVISNFSNFDMVEEKAKELSDLIEETFWKLKKGKFPSEFKEITSRSF